MRVRSPFNVTLSSESVTILQFAKKTEGEGERREKKESEQRENKSQTREPGDRLWQPNNAEDH